MSDRTADSYPNGYAMNRAVMADAPRIEPSLSQRHPSTLEGCSTPAA